MTQRQRAAKDAYARYLRSNKRYLWDCYSTWSPAKSQAYNYCMDLMHTHNGHDLKIISSNGWMFTAGFEFEDDGKPMFMYITKSGDVAVEV